MPNITINFSDIKEQTAVPAGLYSIRVHEVIMKLSSDQVNYYLNWDLVITTPGESIDRHVYLMTSLKPNVLWRLKNVIKSLGIEPGEMNFQVDEETGILLEPDFRNNVAIAKVSNEVYQGVTRDRVEDLYPMDGDLASDIVMGPAHPGGTVVPNRTAARPTPATAATTAPKRQLR
jgi:hypothetical protein